MHPWRSTTTRRFSPYQHTEPRDCHTGGRGWPVVAATAALVETLTLMPLDGAAPRWWPPPLPLPRPSLPPPPSLAGWHPGTQPPPPHPSSLAPSPEPARPTASRPPTVLSPHRPPQHPLFQSSPSLTPCRLYWPVVEAHRQERGAQWPLTRPSLYVYMSGCSTKQPQQVLQ